MYIRSYDFKGKSFSERELLSNLSYTFSFWARLAEIGVRATFITMNFVASLVFEEMNDEISILAQNSADPNQHDSLPFKLKRLIRNNDLACRLVEQINKCFDSVLLIIAANDFITAIFDFHYVQQYLAEKIPRTVKVEFFKTSDYFNFHVGPGAGMYITNISWSKAHSSKKKILNSRWFDRSQK